MTRRADRALVFVLIDEPHDFEPEWLSLAVKKVNPNS
mgnify:CR=1 FL=1